MAGALPVARWYSLRDMPWFNVSRRALLPLLVAAGVRAVGGDGDAVPCPPVR